MCVCACAVLAGVGLGALISECTKLRDEQFIAAAEAVSRMVTEDELARGQLFPSLKRMREVGVYGGMLSRLSAYTGCPWLSMSRSHVIGSWLEYAMHGRPVQMSIIRAPTKVCVCVCVCV